MTQKAGREPGHRASLWGSPQPGGRPRDYLNLAERNVEPESIFGDRLERLREVRDRNEAGIFRANHGLGA